MFYNITKQTLYWVNTLGHLKSLKTVDVTSGFAQKLWELKDIKQKDSTHVKCVKYGTPISIPCGTVCEIVKASYGLMM